MKKLYLLILLVVFSPEAFSEDPLKFNLGVLRSHDLSDSYGGGQMLSGEFMLTKSWYGGVISYGFYQSVSYMRVNFFVEEMNRTINIKSPESANVKNWSFSLVAKPINKSWFSTKIYFGLALTNAKTLSITDIEFSYNFKNEAFDYIKRYYDLSEKKLFGYNAGIGLRFKIYEPLGLKLYFSLQDMKTATFAFVGYGLDFSF